MVTNLSELRAELMVAKIPELTSRRGRDPSIFIIYIFSFSSLARGNRESRRGGQKKNKESKIVR